MLVKVLKDFVDTHTKALRSKGSEIEMTEERFAEAVANLAEYGGGFIEAIETKADEGDEPETSADDSAADEQNGEPEPDMEPEAEPDPEPETQAKPKGRAKK